MTAPFRSYTGVERAAVLMMLVGEEEAAAILQKLDPDEVRELGTAMFAVADVSENDVDFVLDDFVARASERTGITFDPQAQIAAVMNRALGQEKAEGVLARIRPASAAVRGLAALDWLEPAEIAGIIDKEHPQVAAMLIANLNPEIAAQVLEILPDAIQPDILHRIAKLGPVSPDAITTLEQVLAAHNSKPRAALGVTMGGAREVARIMASARKTTEQRVMPKLAKIDKEVARAIEELMFVFDNLLELDDKNLGTLLRNVDSDILIRSLKGCDEEIRGRFYGCMSSRAADGIKDELEQRGPMKLSEVMEAQKAMIAIAKGLAKDGTIQMGGKAAGGDDDYV